MVKGGYIADYSTTANKNDYILFLNNRDLKMENHTEIIMTQGVVVRKSELFFMSVTWDSTQFNEPSGSNPV